MRETSFLSFAMMLFTGILAPAATYHVPDQYSSIQMAIDNANDGDTVIVSPGTYLENINFNGKNIILTSIDPNDPEIVTATIIMAKPSIAVGIGSTGGEGSVVTFENGETSEAMLSGFTIAGGYGTLFEAGGFYGVDAIIIGGGIYCLNASPTITKNVITDNNNENAEQLFGIQGWGGGIGCFISSPTITHNIIKNNSSSLGGGILVGMGNARIANNLIYDNSATGGGGAFVAGGHLINNTIVNNYAGTGGNVYLISYPEFGYCTLINNIISDARGSEGLLKEGASPQDRIEFNNIWDNTGDDFIRSEADEDSFGNIYRDPMFVNPEANDYRLQVDSPCINAGDPNYSIDPNEQDMYGNDRIIYDRIDIGAAEFSGNLRPVADAGGDQLVTAVSDYIILDGGDSYDPDGNTNLTYTWSQLTGPAVTIEDADKPVARFLPVDSGEYVFNLVVSDEQFDSFPDDVRVFVDISVIPADNVERR